jgi:hypothetical protein
LPSREGDGNSGGMTLARGKKGGDLDARGEKPGGASHFRRSSVVIPMGSHGGRDGRSRRRPVSSRAVSPKMTFAIVCPACRVKSRVPDRLRGKRVRCLKCDTRFVVPGQGAAGKGAAGGRTPIRRPRGREAARRNRPSSGYLSVRLPLVLAVVSTSALLIVLFHFLNGLSSPVTPGGGRIDGSWLSGTFAEMNRRFMLFFGRVALCVTAVATAGSWALAAWWWIARRKRESISRGPRLQTGEGKWTGSQRDTGTG